MEAIKLLMLLLIILAPFLIFLSAIQLVGFNDSFYKEEFLKDNVEKSVPETLELHRIVINFVQGESDYLPDNFNEREKKHLYDVRKLILLSKTILYFLIFLFVILFVSLIRLKKTKKILEYFIGKVLLFGGLLMIALSAFLSLLINSNFPFSFELFHKIFFQPGTYAFDPEYDVIVNLYPEGLFMDLGLRIAKFVTLMSFIFMATGAVLLLRNKRIK